MICDILDEIRPEPRLGRRRDLIRFVKDRPGHDLRYAMDFSKLKNELSWIPDESFETGLIKTINWYMDNQKWIGRVKSGEYMSWIEQQYEDSS
jgi:dTDP-glucose 4,6-dehydratase